jgi:uncharacterized protein
VLSFDTNILVYACNADAPECARARQWVEALASRTDVVVSDLMLLEVYLKIRNPRILTAPFSAPEAADYCQAFRSNPRWLLVGEAQVMDDVWRLAGKRGFAIRRIVDARLALSLRHYGVTHFATANEKDFDGFGFERVWNPLKG